MKNMREGKRQPKVLVTSLGASSFLWYAPYKGVPEGSLRKSWIGEFKPFWGLSFHRVEIPNFSINTSPALPPRSELGSVPALLDRVDLAQLGGSPALPALVDSELWLSEYSTENEQELKQSGFSEFDVVST